MRKFASRSFAGIAGNAKNTQSLLRRYQRIMAEADKLREEIEALGGSTGGSSSAQARSRNSVSLVEALKAVLTKKALTVSEAAQRVLDAGYQSTSASFRQIVNQTLTKTDQFERVGHGLYKAK